MKSETIFRKRCDKFLDKLDNSVDFSIQQLAIRGDFDKIICIQGWFVGSEIKDEDGKPDPLQSYKASKVRTQGKGIAFIWRPQNDKDVKNFLTQLNAGVLDRSLLQKINREENNL